MKNTILFSFLFFCSSIVSAQGEDFLRLQNTWNKVLSAESEQEKESSHNSFMGQLGRYLSRPNGEDLSQLTNVKDLYSTDSNLRIVSYFYQKNQDEFKIGGTILLRKSNNGEQSISSFVVAPLIGNNRAKIKRDTAYHIKDWPAAYYYRIIQKKDQYGMNSYTLIGWIPKNRISQQKIVDVLWYDGENFKFGAPIFEREGKREYRLLYEYGAQNTMRLSYQEEKDQIIMDHLSPPGAEYHGIYEYYGPDFSFDAFRWENDRWLYYPDIDIDEGLNKKKADFDKKDKILEETPVYKSE